MKIYKKSKRSAAVPLAWFYSTLAVNRKPPRCRHWRRIRSSHSTSAYNQYIPSEPPTIFHFQVDLNVLQDEMCGKTCFFYVYVVFFWLGKTCVTILSVLFYSRSWRRQQSKPRVNPPSSRREKPDHRHSPVSHFC